jgi:hypothetical protein
MLGIENRKFREKVIELALSDPKAYYAQRARALDLILKDGVEDIYNKVYNLLSAGQVGTDFIFKDAGGQDMSPNLPMNEIGKHALSVCNSYKEILEGIYDELLPADISQIANVKLALKNSGTGAPAIPASTASTT